ncbi:NAD(P)-dependent oxidoreductase [Pinibacter aurantiacus]|uniref:NAD(P)H-binding protein n=1 Tax=Pinibacter aurantiacus TaxID=2851599 RepID=A0A9E2SB99_9BACT|nr:NAD(P)H-binding protein [Pinibacter aurantiacus]MBV4358288.1 NAD(P)H-binding protein [Pinibacter aurantiacus]
MKIALFGATGQVGRELAKLLLAKEDCLKALVRDSGRIEAAKNLQLIEGDVLNAVAVEECIKGCDVVYILLGTRGNKATTVYSSGTINIVMAMEKFGVRRVICLSSAGVLGYDGGFFGRIVAPLTLWRPFRDKRRQLEILSVTALDWTIVRPTEIKDKPAGVLEVNYHKMGKPSISMKSLVQFLYDQIFAKDNIHKMPIIGD